MSLRLFFARILHQGRTAIQRTYKPNRLDTTQTFTSSQVAHATTAPARQPNIRPRNGIRKANAPSTLACRLRSRVVEGVKPRVANSLAVELKKKLSNSRGPVLALVGVITADSLVTKQDEMESVCCEIRSVMKKRKRLDCMEEDDNTADVTLEQIEFGPLIAKGCNAVVYAAKWQGSQPADGDPEYNLAVKMMFNFEAESMAPIIFKSMCREIVPAKWISLKDAITSFDDSFTCRSLPPHPNIVDMLCAFVDRVPDLSQNMAVYPDALPRRINPNGAGRNMSLFLVMKRYSCTVEEYFRTYNPTPRARLLLLTQLLEAISHMVKNQIAHRDLKIDNLLVDVSEGADTPLLVVTDFGCCRADPQQGLILPYTSTEVDRGGNSALMAPEVACAIPGSFSRIDYSKADIWTAGAIAYQLLGFSNPFYFSKTGDRTRLDSRRYSEEELPELAGDVHTIIKELVKALLRRSAKQRPQASVAATVCQLLLWAPKSWTDPFILQVPTHAQVMDWLVTITTKSLCEIQAGCASRVESDLISTFLTRVTLSDVLEALAFSRNHIPY